MAWYTWFVFKVRLVNMLSVLETNYPAMVGVIWSPFLARQPSPHWKSLIAHSDMHHPISGINSLIYSVSLASHASTHFLIDLSAHLCHHHHSHRPSFLHSFTPGSKPTFSTYPSHLSTPSTLDCLHDHMTGLMMLLDLFLVLFVFNISVCPIWWTKLTTHQLFTAR